MKPGLYEQLITAATADALAQLPPDLQAFERAVDPAEAPTTLTRHLLRALLRTLATVKDPTEAVNRLLMQLLAHAQNESLVQGDLVHSELRELIAVVRRSGLAEAQEPPRPSIPLNATALLTNARGEPRIGAEVEKELRTADRVDLLCAFLKFSGYRLLRQPLREMVERGGRLRVITTCYLGATDVEVLEELSEYGEVRVSYDTRRTRLHAKAWLFHRHTGYHTAYIGSSNISKDALLDGLEWNVRLSPAENPGVIEKFQGTFDSYWQDAEFEPYVRGQDRSRFERACRREERAPEDYALEVRPYPFQQEILEKLQAERVLHGRWRNLVVAATGCGKTVIAALDYRDYVRRHGPANLLFVAHRDEILNQSLQTFRAVLRDGSFGDRWTGGQDRNLFASVQKLNHQDLDKVAPEHFDVIIVDEFHHSEAPTYRRLLEHFRPKLLLGLTATPERGDGQSILGWFDGRIAAELRLWDALERGFLSPFHYFGLHDDVDLAQVRWARGYDAGELDRLYTGHHARAKLVLKQVHEHIKNPGGMRALGFCAGVAHAQFMAAQFQQAGLAATVVLGVTPSEERRQSLKQLREGQLQAIFTVDVFNEGVDVPHIDTVLLLRPTQSATVFLQQIGRGLRLADGKDCLTILDFIGQAHAQFRFDQNFQALLGGTRKDLIHQVEHGFPTLPSGCSLQLDRISQRVVLENLKRQIHGRKQLVAELQRLGPDVGLGQFLERTGAELDDVYQGQVPGWASLRAAARYGPQPPEAEARAISRLLHLDSPRALDFFTSYLGAQVPPVVEWEDERLADVLRYSLWTGSPPPLERLWELPAVREELLALMPVLRDRVDHLSYTVPGLPLEVHCHYSLRQILAAWGVTQSVREGVYYHKPSGCDLLFVTIRKSERDYSPTTMYQDYALSPELFHWQSQNTTVADGVVGRRYRGHRLGGTTALLFVRESLLDGRGGRAPYLFLGPAEYISHEGERPMAVVWRLARAIPVEFFRGMRLAAG